MTLIPMGLHEIARNFGVPKSTALSWTRNRTFPAPAHELAMGPIWHAADVDAWVAQNRPSSITKEDA